jgi:dienelactone hydrolase
VTDDRKALRQETLKRIGVDQFPEAIPLNMRVHWKRKFPRYEEWKIEYDVETAETMPIEAGKTVPAYLLIPRHNGEAPHPAIVCFHQCALNCAIGKEAVVGKAPWSHEYTDWDGPPLRWIAASRLDQAYGFDLVHQGFVVLAPDSICCGERHIEAIRQPGENCSGCWEHLDEQLGRSGTTKHTLDGVRAVDVLQSLDFVDSERIGAIGHSMGSSDVENVMLADDRVKAGIISGGNASPESVPLLSPRLFISLMGDYDGPANRMQEAQKTYGDALEIYRADDAPTNFLFLTAKTGHVFSDGLKWMAYKRLKEHFDMLSPRALVDLGEIVTEAREASMWMTEEEQGGTFPNAIIDGLCPIVANRGDVVSALLGLFLYVSDKASQVDLRVAIEENQEDFTVVVRIPTDRVAYTDPEGASYPTLREVDRILSEHDSSLRQSHSDSELQYLVSFLKASSAT